MPTNGANQIKKFVVLHTKNGAAARVHGYTGTRRAHSQGTGGRAEKMAVDIRTRGGGGGAAITEVGNGKQLLPVNINNAF